MNQSTPLKKELPFVTFDSNTLNDYFLFFYEFPPPPQSGARFLLMPGIIS